MKGQILIAFLFFGSISSFPFSKNTESCEIRRKRSLIHSDSNEETQNTRRDLKDNKRLPSRNVISPAVKNILAQAKSITKPKGYEEMMKKAAELNKVPQITEEVDTRGYARSFGGRGFINGKDKRWDYKMYVMIDDELTREEKDWTIAAFYTLKAAMKCFDFLHVPVGDLPNDIDHIHIKIYDPSVSSKCGTKLGRQGGKQIINIGRTCKDRFGVTMHETMHALGFFHEHTRKDRDEYVEIHWNKVPERKRKDFKIRKNQGQIDEYDFESIMHYAISKQLTPREGKVPPGVTVGQRNHLSLLDRKRLQQVYPCKDDGTAPGSENSERKDSKNEKKSWAKTKENNQLGT